MSSEEPETAEKSVHTTDSTHDTLAEPLAPNTGGMSLQEIRDLPVMFAFDPVIPKVFGISRSAAYRALAAGQLPFTPLKIGRRLKVRRADLLAALSISDSG